MAKEKQQESPPLSNPPLLVTRDVYASSGGDMYQGDTERCLDSSYDKSANPKRNRTNGIGGRTLEVRNLANLVKTIRIPKRRANSLHIEVVDSSFMEKIKRLCKELQEIIEERQQIDKVEDYKIASPISPEIMTLCLPRGFKMLISTPI